MKKMLNALLLIFAALAPVSASWNVTAAVQYADETWNCNGDSPPCQGCSTVSSGSDQDPYGCAPYVAHILTAGGVDTGCGTCGSMSCYSSVERNGKTYDLNVVGSKDSNCDNNDGGCLMDYLLDKGWIKVTQDEVNKGVVCAVDGGSNFNEPWGHIVFGVAKGLINAHNVARYHQSIDVYDGHVRMCLKNKNQ